MEKLIAAAMKQNFVPVIDGKESFIGIVKRNSIIQFCYDRYKQAENCAEYSVNRRIPSQFSQKSVDNW